MAATDVIVLGADIEGLAAAAFLARGGKRVVVVDDREEAGGRWARAPFHPDHFVPGLLHDPQLVRRGLLAGLELENHGLAWSPTSPTFAVIGSDGRRLDVSRGGAGTAPDSADAKELARWQGLLDKAKPVVDAVLDDAPPHAMEPSLGELVRLGKTALKLRRLGERDMLELMRIPVMSATDWMEEHFADPLLQAGLVAPALTGSVFGPRAPGTAGLALLHRTAGATTEPTGGPPALVDALVACCKTAGVELRLGTTVKRIALERGRVAGLDLGGAEHDRVERLEARVVASTFDPRRTLIDLVAPGTLGPKLEDAVTSWRTRGTTALVWLALSRPPALPGDPERVLAVGSLDQLERVSDGLKYDRLPEEPWLDVKVWSRTVRSSAPEGKATVSIQVNGVPPRTAWTAGEREALLKTVLERLDRVAPETSAAIEASELVMPCDVEERYGATGGHLYHGELALDQLWVQRPSMVLARYATPVEGLYLCGSGCHPGGPFAGGAGVLGARTVLGAES